MPIGNTLCLKNKLPSQSPRKPRIRIFQDNPVAVHRQSVVSVTQPGCVTGTTGLPDNPNLLAVEI